MPRLLKIVILELLAASLCWAQAGAFNLTTQELGDPVYRYYQLIPYGFNSGVDYNHAAIFSGIDGANNLTVIEADGTKVSSGSLSGSMTNHLNQDNLIDEYYGSFNLNNHTMTFSDRVMVVSNAEALRAAAVPYPSNWVGAPQWALQYNGDTFDGSVGDIAAIRCDGVVEYSYERAIPSLSVWGQNGAHYSIVDYPGEHNNMPNPPTNPSWELSPKAQRGGYGNTNTHLTWAAVTAPPTVSATQSGTSVTITADDVSGIHHIAYQIGLGGSLQYSPTQPQIPTAHSYSFTFPVTESNWVYFFARDNGGNISRGSINVVLTPSSPPAITSVLTASGQVGTAFNYQITATNSPTVFNATNLPAGLSINMNNGVISGMPTSAVTKSVTISATNSGGTGTSTLILTINPQSNTSPPGITSAPTTSGTVGTPFSYQITATNSPASFNATNLPSGLVVNTSNGLIAGTPTSAVAKSVTISATNSGGTGTTTLSLTINPQGSPSSPAITSALTVSGQVGTSFNYQITATNTPASFNATNLPAGLSVNTSNGAISGTPTSAGTYWVALSATNSGGTGSAGMTLTINPQTTPSPLITSALAASGTVGTAFSYQITATNSPTSFSTINLPAGLSVNTSNGVISGTPTSAVTKSVTISASNSGGSGSATLTLTINPQPNSYLLTVSKAGTGNGAVGSSDYVINCGATCSASYTENTSVTLTATAPSGSTFTGWSGAGCSGAGSCVVTMSAAQSVTATFNATTTVYQLTVSKAGTGNGVVTSNDGGLNCGPTCSMHYTANGMVYLTGTAAVGSVFTGWGGAGCSGTGDCGVLMNVAQSITATFNTTSAIAPTGIYFDEVSITTIVASGYAATPAFSGLETGSAGVNVAKNGAYSTWRNGNKWTTKTAMPTASGELAAGVIGNKLYAVGGYGASALGTNQEYDPVSNTWSIKTSMPTARAGLLIGVIGDKLYAVGGFNGNETENEAYDPVSNTWSTKASMPTARHYLAGGVINGKLYAVGGTTYDYLKTNEAYDPANDTWSTKADMPTGRDMMSAAVISGKLYVVGGSISSGQVNTNEAYDPASNTWSTKAVMPTARYFLSAGAVGGKLYALGGFTGPISLLNSNEEYDPVSNIWSPKAVMPTSRMGSAVGVINGKLYVVGGETANPTSLNTNEEYDPGVAVSFSGLTPNTQYNFKAKARDSAGNETSESPTVSTYTLAVLPAAGSPVFASVGVYSFSSNWISNGNPTGTLYRAQISASSSFTSAISSDTYNTTATFTGLASSKRYYTRIAAINGSGIMTSYVTLGSTTTRSITALAPAFTAHTATSLTTSWTTVAGANYVAVLASDSGYANIVTSVTQSGNTKIFSGLSSGTSYYFEVKLATETDDAFALNQILATTNNSPMIASLIANPVSISTGAVTTITCAASDSDGDTLTYNWSAASGTISGSSYQATWTAPASSGTYTISCAVSDGKGGVAQQSVNLNVTRWPDKTFGEIIYSDDFSGATLDSIKWQSGGNSVNQADGILTLSAAATDNTGWVRTIKLGLFKTAIHLHHWMQPAGDYFMPTISLNDDSGDSIASLVFSKSSYGPDHCGSGWPDTSGNYNKVLLRTKSDSCVVVGTANSDTYYGRWTDTYISYDAVTGNIIVDLDSDGIMDLNYNVPITNRKVVNNLYVNGYGWWTGHLHKLDSIIINGTQAGTITPLVPVITARTDSSFTASWPTVAGANYVAVLASDSGYSNIVSSITQSGNAKAYSGLSVGTSYYFEVKLSTETDAAFLLNRISTTTNNLPTVTWTAETNYVSDGLDPETGNTATSFIYRVKYTDTDNDEPSAGYPKLYVLKGGTTVQLVTMNYVSGTNSFGAIYSTSTVLPPGADYSYHFAAYDVWGATATGISTGTLNAPNVIDISSPTVTSFTIPAAASSLTVAITALTATDNIAVTGYLVNESATTPLPGAIGWSGGAPANYTFASAGTKTLYAWAKDAIGNVSASLSRSVTIDVSSPTITAFTIPATTASLTVSITALTATDNIGVTGYLINESATMPLPGVGGWAGSAPASYTFASAGTKTLYAWAKDAAGNVSTSLSASIIIDISSPTVTAFTIPATTSSLTVAITVLTATDNIGVTGYLVNESATTPLPGVGGWAGSAPASYTFASAGTKTLYAWTKDAVGNVSTSLNASVTVDVSSPTVTAFTIPATASSLTVAITTFTATDNITVTGYLVNESAVTPLPGAGGWAGSAPASYTLASEGVKTLYAWAKDAAGNVSTGLSHSVTIDVSSPTVTTFTIPATGSALTVVITALTATDNIGVTGYLVNESAITPLPGAGGWAGSAPVSYTFTSEGAKTLYAWAKDAAGNVSTNLNSPVTMIRAIGNPVVTSITPSLGTNTERDFRFILTGEHFKDGDNVWLEKSIGGQGKTRFASVANVNAGHSNIDAVIDLMGLPVGAWSVYVKGVDSDAGGLSDSFIVSSVSVQNGITQGETSNTQTSTVTARSDTGTELITVTIPAGVVLNGIILISTAPGNNPISVSSTDIKTALTTLPVGISAIPSTLHELAAFSDGVQMNDFGTQTVSWDISYQDADNDGVIDGTRIKEYNLQLVVLDTSTVRWVDVPRSEYSIDAQNKLVRVIRHHFSVYTLAGPSMAANLDLLKLYPLPWQPNSSGRFRSANVAGCGTGLIFENLTSEGLIRIYTIAGDLVREITFSSADNGCKSWDGKNTAGRNATSGVYITVIKNTGAGGGKVIQKKFAIER